MHRRKSAYYFLNDDNLLVWSSPMEMRMLGGGVVVFLFLLKTSSEVVCSSWSVKVWVIKIRVFFFCVKDSLGRLATTLIFLVSSASSTLLILESILSAKRKHANG